VYIGSAYDVGERWKNNGVGYRNQYVGKAIQKHGWDNIKKEVLLYIPLSEQEGDPIREKELELIRQYEGRSYNQHGTKVFHAEIANGMRRGALCEPKVYWEVDGVSKPAREWCEEYKIGYSQVQRRMRQGLSVKQALTFPPVPRGKCKHAMDYWRECGCFNEA
jgi:hypothetical protein